MRKHFFESADTFMDFESFLVLFLSLECTYELSSKVVEYAV